MTDNQLYKEVCLTCSRITTKKYSTSFSLGIKLLDKEIRGPIYAIYGFVRFADEIVDTFHDFDKKKLLDEFKEDTYQAIELGISLNPILHSFQEVVNRYKIDIKLVEQFFISMEMDLKQTTYSKEQYDHYILGSAEVVGLMCLFVFTKGDKEDYQKLKSPAQRLGSAFQKVNFLRDIKYDGQDLQRQYFPQLEEAQFSDEVKKEIESDISDDFKQAVIGIKKLPLNSRLGVYLAYRYYFKLFQKIVSKSSENILDARIRISNPRKCWILVVSYFALKLSKSPHD